MAARYVAAGQMDGQRGFTLLEVLVALTVLGLVVVVLFQGLTGGLKRTERDTDRIALVLAARQVLARLDLDLAGVQPLQAGEIGRIRWRIERTPTPNSFAAPLPPASADNASNFAPRNGRGSTSDRGFGESGGFAMGSGSDQGGRAPDGANPPEATTRLLRVVVTVEDDRGGSLAVTTMRVAPAEQPR